MSNKGNGKSILLLIGGLLLIAAALSLTVYNVADGWRAGWSAQKILAQMETGEVETVRDSGSEEETIGQEEESESWTAVIPVDGNDYMGVLELPDQGLTLPVMNQWSYPKLRTAPCRYQGSAAEGNLIIAGHNYERHFGGLKKMEPGEPVVLIDAEGNRYDYVVQKVEILESTAVEEMEAGEWDLTLFTCTVGGRSRVTVRCSQVNGIK
ncbi:MAG TPA: sortase [Candidatus Cottocaccamicrobium excrementipullorum]|nr:sortase [Candidatus Cottocaccamicrobium excrementipullorum]